MSIWQEIRLFISTIIDWAVLLVVFTFFFFTCNVETVNVFGRVTTLPVPTSPSFAAEFFGVLVSNIAPAGVPLVFTSPTTAFVVQVKLAFLLALFFTFPVFLFRLIRFLTPALYLHEQRLLYVLTVPLSVLFLGGVYFAYHYIAPATFAILYSFAEPIGAVPLLGATEFIGVAMSLLITTGIAFTLPVFMVLLTALRAIRASFWLAKFRYAAVFFLIMSAIITPDGSGVSMLLLSVPVSVLYAGGALVCVRVERVLPKEEDMTAPTFTNS